MKKVKISIEFFVKGDVDDFDTLTDEVHQKLMEDIESGSLDFEAEQEDEDADDEF